MNKFIIDIRKMVSSVRWAFNWKEWNPSETDFLRAISCIQLEEKERLGKFVFRKDVKASVIGRLMMRKFINECALIPYQDIIFMRDDNNKPILKQSKEIVSFNVSHQGDYTVFVGENKDVKLGVDIMKLEYTGGKELPEFFRLMNRNFSCSEWKEIKGMINTSKKEQIAMFCRHWALKESFVKALGIGIVTDLKSLDFTTRSTLVEHSIITDSTLFINKTKQDWLFEESLLDSEHCVAVALQENGKAPASQYNKFQVIDFVKLMEHAIPLFPEDSEYGKKYFLKEENP